MKLTNVKLARILTVICNHTDACPARAALNVENWWGTDVEKCPFGKEIECQDVTVRAWNKVLKRSE